jgi:DNA-binding NtrC family response regulator
MARGPLWEPTARPAGLRSVKLLFFKRLDLFAPPPSRTAMATILYVDDDPSVGLVLEETLARSGHSPLGARNVPEALLALEQSAVDLIISDYRMPGISGLEFLQMLAGEGHDVPLIMLTGHASIEHAVMSIKAGAIDYITKPVRPQQLELAVDQALEFVRLRRENEALRKEVQQFRNEKQIIGDSPVIRRILQTVSMAAPTRATVLLQGESGTGKELFARAIHDQSERRDKPFIKLNCAALPEGLVESALFGHEKGAFTGAIKRVEGAFERAHRGTLLLDEISEMRLDLQAKLLRVLQEQEFERVGGTSPIKVDVRIIATTNRDLAVEADQGGFRHDLYYRLSTIPVLIPPLRERPDDVPLLALRFAMRCAAELGKKIDGFAPEALETLQRFPWPGNVRELQHVIERAVILTPDPLIQPHCLEGTRFGLAHSMGSSAIRAKTIGKGGATPPPGTDQVGSAADGRIQLASLNVADAERVLIQHALTAADNNRTKAAELLGISVRTLRNKLNGPGKDPDADDDPG